MTTSALTAPTGVQTDAAWLRVVQVSLAVCLVPLVVYAVVGTFFTTISGGDFKYAADYWYTGVGLPFAVVGIAHTLGVHRLQHGADGRLGAVGVWVNAIALTELFAQLLASVATGSEVRWGPCVPDLHGADVRRRRAAGRRLVAHRAAAQVAAGPVARPLAARHLRRVRPMPLCSPSSSWPSA